MSNRRFQGATSEVTRVRVNRFPDEPNARFREPGPVVPLDEKAKAEVKLVEAYFEPKPDHFNLQQVDLYTVMLMPLNWETEKEEMLERIAVVLERNLEFICQGKETVSHG